MDLGHSVWLIGVPVVIIMFVNVIMLINVIIMIRAKILQNNNNCSAGARRGSRTMANIKQLTPLCVLFPVLGLHFFLVPARPEPKSQFEHTYDLLLTISSSFQGGIIFLHIYHNPH